MTVPTKFDVVEKSVGHFIKSMHRPGYDRGMIASFGNTFRIDSDFTSNAPALCAAVATVGRSITNEQTRYFDSLVDGAAAFYRAGRRNAVWCMTVISDGNDNCSTHLKDNPAGAGHVLGTAFNHDPTNYLTVIGVGAQGQLDATALVTLGRTANCPVIHLDNFQLVEEVFKAIALRVTSRLVGVRYSAGGASWADVARVRELRTCPIDWMFLLDRSGSMKEPAVRPSNAGAQKARAAAATATSWWSRN